MQLSFTATKRRLSTLQIQRIANANYFALHPEHESLAHKKDAQWHVKYLCITLAVPPWVATAAAPTHARAIIEQSRRADLVLGNGAFGKGSECSLACDCSRRLNI